MRTHDQKMAEKAFACANGIFRDEGGQERTNDEYKSFALSFPSLIHSCGLVQALAFAEAKGKKKGYMKNYLKDLEQVLKEVGEDDILNQSREVDNIKYMRLSRRALSAASWIKRYVEALAPDSKSDTPKNSEVGG